MSAGGHCRQNDRNDQGGYHQCPEVMKNHHHDRVRQAHTCYLMKADAGRQKLKTDFYSTFQRHDNTSNKEADKSVPTICWTLCWPSGHYNEVQMKGRGWNILRKGNTNSWEGSQAFHRGQVRCRNKCNDIREGNSPFHCESPQRWQHSGEHLSNRKTSTQNPHLQHNPSHPSLKGNNSVQFGAIPMCKAKVQWGAFIKSHRVQMLQPQVV